MPSGRVAVFTVIATSLVLAVITLVWGPTIQIRPQNAEGRPTLAVLPFENLTADDELELLASNVTVAVADALEDHDELELIPRELALSYKGIEGGVREAAASLEADFVVAGSVAREGPGLEVAVYFIDVDVESRLWAERFEFHSEERQSIPDSIAARVRHALEKP